MSIEIDTFGYDEAMAEITIIINKLDEDITEFIRELAETAVFEARNNIQNNRSIVSADLLNSTNVLELGVDSATVGSTAPYAGYVERGRGPVRPIKAKVLHWIDAETGKDVFTTYAGPAEPQPFWEPALVKILRDYKWLPLDRLTDSVKQAIADSGADSVESQAL